MSFRDGPLQDLKIPLAWTATVATVVAGVASLALLLDDQRADKLVQRGGILGERQLVTERQLVQKRLDVVGPDLAGSHLRDDRRIGVHPWGKHERNNGKKNDDFRIHGVA